MRLTRYRVPWAPHGARLRLKSKDTPRNFKFPKISPKKGCFISIVSVAPVVLAPSFFLVACISNAPKICRVKNDYLICFFMTQSMLSRCMYVLVLLIEVLGT